MTTSPSKKIPPDVIRCQAYTGKGTRCTRVGTCVSFQPYSRYCVQHAREMNPSILWL